MANNDKVVEVFAGYMLDVMNKHQQAKGDSWKTCNIGFLEGKLHEELAEYADSGDKRELIDIANVCMMLYHRKTVPFLDLPSPKKAKEKPFFFECDVRPTDKSSRMADCIHLHNGTCVKRASCMTDSTICGDYEQC